MFLRLLRNFIVFLFLSTLLRATECCERMQEQPNIVVILADDLGSYDLSCKGSNQIITPNIDSLAYQGVLLNRHYSAPMCSPSRSALLSGKYSIHTGMQNRVILADEPRSLPLDEVLLSDYLQEVGYRTHIVGKWHLGLARKIFTPTYRGFHSHIGNLGPYINYFDHTYKFSYYPAGFDFRYNEEVYRNRTGEYLTDVLADEASKIIIDHKQIDGPLFLYIAHVAPHSPLEATSADLASVTHIANGNRRTCAAMIKALDRSVGTVIKSLSDSDLLDNTCILFLSDNGGPTTGELNTMASNYPLKGQKDSPWEGAIRGPALFWCSQMEERHYVSDHLVHITDWLSTLAELGGSTTYKQKTVDGSDIWPTVSCNESPIRTEIVHNIDPIANYISYLNNGFKYVAGTTWNGRYDTWLGDDMTYESSSETPNYAQIVMQSDVWIALNPYANQNLTSNDIANIRSGTEIVCQGLQGNNNCNPLQQACLFDIYADPCEENNLSNNPTYAAILDTIEGRVQELANSMVPPNNLPSDRNANPQLHGNIWTWWLDEMAPFNLNSILQWWS